MRKKLNERKEIMKKKLSVATFEGWIDKENGNATSLEVPVVPSGYVPACEAHQKSSIANFVFTNICF